VNCGIRTGAISLGMPSPLYRTSLTLYMSWTYDPEIRLHSAQNPLEVSPAVDMVEYGEYSDDGKSQVQLFEANHSASIPHFINFIQSDYFDEYICAQSGIILIPTVPTHILSESS